MVKCAGFTSTLFGFQADQFDQPGILRDLGLNECRKLLRRVGLRLN
jgi:hypothetical protein